MGLIHVSSSLQHKYKQGIIAMFFKTVLMNMPSKIGYIGFAGKTSESTAVHSVDYSEKKNSNALQHCKMIIKTVFIHLLCKTSISLAYRFSITSWAHVNL